MSAYAPLPWSPFLQLNNEKTKAEKAESTPSRSQEAVTVVQLSLVLCRWSFCCFPQQTALGCAFKYQRLEGWRWSSVAGLLLCTYSARLWLQPPTLGRGRAWTNERHAYFVQLQTVYSFCINCKLGAQGKGYWGCWGRGVKAESVVHQVLST